MIIQLMLKHGAFKRLGVKMLIIQKNCVNSQRDFNSCPAMVMYAVIMSPRLPARYLTDTAVGIV